ncbi:MAG: serine/threonine protein kinase, partial [Planctomycetaceae bacterium]|nr:serine/threonine protein kinase [Planctomycetaceae bacterium]
MLRCLFCEAELSDSLLRSGCCPNCGGRLMWPDEAEPQGAVSPRSASPPRDADAPQERDRLGDVLPSPAPAAPANADAPQPPAAPRILGRVVEQPAAPKAPGNSGPSKADLPPDVLARVTSAWSGAFDSATVPRHTVKASSHDTAMAPSLVIRSRQLSGIDRAPVDEPDYELLNIIGEGGVGVVYAARQNSIDRMVAVKMLKPQAADSESPHDKFLSEAVVTGELEHPNIVPIYDLGSTTDGTLFYSMKRVQGTPWDRAMARKSLAENLEILMKVCDAVAFAHSRGVIHRDLKPENVMLGGFGEVLVMDWGIALIAPVDGQSRNIRQSATMGGTPAYMAPEMVTGPLERVSPASDVYLLGALLYEIVTGLAPHNGATIMDCLYSAAANEI